MEPIVVLEKLRVLLAATPSLAGRGTFGQEQFAWIGRASALISAWSQTEGIAFGVAATSLAGNLNREMNVGTIFTTIHKAIAQLENTLPQPTGQAFGPGAAYDFFRALRSLVAATDKSLFVVDPYMDAETFDGYLSALPSGRDVRLLFSRYADDVRIASEKFSIQHGGLVEARKSKGIHDRILFVDKTECWVLGASIKDAALKKPTYLAPLPRTLPWRRPESTRMFGLRRGQSNRSVDSDTLQQRAARCRRQSNNGSHEQWHEQWGSDSNCFRSIPCMMHLTTGYAYMLLKTRK